MRQRLKGAAVASYYPPRIGTIAQLRSLYPENELLDDDEEDWLEHLNVARSRGKSVPKKKRTAAGKSSPCCSHSSSAANHIQSRRSSTRGDKRTYVRPKIPSFGTLYINCTSKHWTAFHLDGRVQELYGSLYINYNHQRHLRTSNCAGTVGYILLFTPLWTSPLITPHCFSNSSSQGSLATRCSGCTGAFTL
jgi:hypothetical protein